MRPWNITPERLSLCDFRSSWPHKRCQWPEEIIKCCNSIWCQNFLMLSFAKLTKSVQFLHANGLHGKMNMCTVKYYFPDPPSPLACTVHHWLKVLKLLQYDGLHILLNMIFAIHCLLKNCPWCHQNTNEKDVYSEGFNFHCSGEKIHKCFFILLQQISKFL